MQLDASISAVVTGGASGLGLATAKALKAQGVKVAVFDMNAEKGERAAREEGLLFCEVDVTSDESVDAGFAKARAAHGQERILVNCAGIGPAMRKTITRDRATGALVRHPMDAFMKVLNVNLAGTFRCISASAAGMMGLPLIGDERGVIVNTGSIAGVEGQLGMAAYGASKAGVIGMALPIARDLAGENIRVNTILPGIFHTPMFEAAAGDQLQSLSAGVLSPKRLGDPKEYASLALELCRNGYFNAEAVRLDGGIRLAPR